MQKIIEKQEASVICCDICYCYANPTLFYSQLPYLTQNTSPGLYQAKQACFQDISGRQTDNGGGDGGGLTVSKSRRQNSK